MYACMYVCMALRVGGSVGVRCVWLAVFGSAECSQA